jgi:hypothetical protein
VKTKTFGSCKWLIYSIYTRSGDSWERNRGLKHVYCRKDQSTPACLNASGSARILACPLLSILSLLTSDKQHGPKVQFRLARLGSPNPKCQPGPAALSLSRLFLYLQWLYTLYNMYSSRVLLEVVLTRFESNIRNLNHEYSLSCWVWKI